MQPCEGSQEPPVALPYRVVLQLWLAAEALLATCAQSKQRLIEFERNVPLDNKTKETK